MNISKQVSLRGLTFAITQLLDNGAHLDIIETEKQVVNKNIINYLLETYKDSSPLGVYKVPVNSHYIDKGNLILHNVLIGEYNSSQPGRSGKKWGIKENGLALINALVTEALTSDHYN